MNEKLKDVRRDIASKAASEPPVSLLSTRTSAGAKEKWRKGATLLLRETGNTPKETDELKLAMSADSSSSEASS